MSNSKIQSMKRWISFLYVVLISIVGLEVQAQEVSRKIQTGALSRNSSISVKKGILPEMPLPKGKKSEPVPTEIAQPMPVKIQKPAGLVQLRQIDLKKELGAKTNNEFKETRGISSLNSPLGWQTLVAENFEGGFPNTNGWGIYYHPDFPYFWDAVTNTPYTGSWSGWCVGGAATGYPSLDPNADSYIDNMESWMTYGPFSLSDATDAQLELRYWLDSEQNHDYFSWLASTDFENWGGYIVSGNSNGYQFGSLDLKNVPNYGNLIGQSQVWIGFRFKADASVTRKGTFLDDIILKKFTASTPTELVADRMYLRPAPNSGTEVTNPIAGQAYYLYFDWRNTGVTASNFPIELKLNNTVICAYNSGTIAGNSTMTTYCTSPVIWPAGHNAIQGVLDASNVITETDENNNSVSRTYSSTPGSSCTFTDNFDDGVPDGWTPQTPSRWEISSDAGNLRYFLNTTDYDSPDGMRLGEISLIDNNCAWNDFTFDCIARSLDAAVGGTNADLDIVFGYQDPYNYYFVMFNLVPNLTNITRIQNGSSFHLATYSSPTLADGEYHAIRIERNSGHIRVLLDGNQILEATDNTFGAGRIGVGSYNDSGYFDNIAISGPSTPRPNLIGASLFFNPASVNPGGNINLSGIITNSGNASTGANVKVNFFLSTDPNAPNYNLYLHSFFMNALAAGQNSSFNQSGTVPANAGAGLYYVWMSIDPDNTINESNESDNQSRTTSQVQVTPPPLPNLVTTVLSFNPVSVNPGGAINLTGTVANNGNASTGANFKINFFLSTDPNTPNYNLFLHSFFMNALAAGQNSSFNQTGTVPGNTAQGSYYVWISIDPDNMINESNETDNQSRTISQVQVLPSSQCQLAWKVDVTVQDAGSNSALLSFGLGATAANDIDPACGEAELPPAPPSGIFDARFELPVSPPKASLKDYRNSSQQTVTWRVKFQPGVNGPMTFSWNPANFPAGSVSLKDEIIGTLVNVNMKAQSSYTLNNPGISSLKIELGDVCRDVMVIVGWNVVSVPVLANNMAVSALFPDGVSQAFAFNNGYTSATTLTNGKGYWIKFNTAKTYNICGIPVTPKRIPVVAGWNIIGPFETDVPVASITSSPANIIASAYFGYNNGYTQATTLSVGKGYWVKASAAGELILPGSAMAKQATETNATRMAPQQEVNSAWPMLVLKDSKGNFGRIYLAPAAEISADFEMPPVPPVGIFDVRFSSGRYVETLENGALEIQINSASYPIRIKAHNLGDRALNVKDALGGNALHEALTSGKEIIVSKAIDKIMVETAIQLPSRYALSQNYPNPFNPTTMIRFAIPEKGHVKLTVYNIVGEKVAELVNQELPSGYHQVEFNGKTFASGLYFYVMESGSFRDLKKMVVAQ